MTDLNTFLNKVNVFDDSSSCLIDATLVANILKAKDKLSKCSKAKSFKDIIKCVNEVNDLLDVDTIGNNSIVPINDWNDVKENVERFIPFEASLEDAEKFREFMRNI